MTLWDLLLVCSMTLLGADTAASIVVLGAGATLPMTLYLDALFSYRFVEPSVEITFDATTTDHAFCRLTNYSKECAAGDTAQPLFLDWGSVVALPTADYYARYPDLQLYPTVASAVVPIYNLNGVTDLVLSMQTLAKIWSGRITTWDHPDIQATNPNFTSWNIPANQPITLVARADSVGTTQVFKKALAGVDPVFRANVGTASAASWNGTQPVLKSGLQLLISYVMCTKYTLGYSVLGDALVNYVPTAKLNRSGFIVEASAASVQYAMLELGLQFGNNNDDKAHLTADLNNAINPLAWPIASYAYVAVRKSTLRYGATCATVSAMMNFWLWFWSDAETEALATSLGFSMLPQVVQDFVVSRFKADIRCDGAVVWQEEMKTVLSGYGPEPAIAVFTKLQQAYSVVNSSVELNYSTLPEHADGSSLQAGDFVISTSPLSTSSNNIVSLVLAGQALVAVSQFALTLDGLTLAKILNGDIQTWLHPDIVALNPAGIVDSSGHALNNTAQRIVLLQGPTAGSASLTALLQRYYPNYTGAAIRSAALFAEEGVLWSVVLGTPFSLSVTALVGQLPQELQLASMMGFSGDAVVAPSLAAVQACASAEGYNPLTNLLDLGASTNSSCYPLSLTLYLNVRRLCQTDRQAPADIAAVVVNFVQWLYSGDSIDSAVLQLNVAPFQDAISVVQAANDEALFRLSCQVRPTTTDIVPLLLAIVTPIAAVVVISIALCGWWLWRVTEYNRALRKKFSNDNVAESCAEAIARFDLDAVEWLREVKEPNKIQLAFLNIVGLLTEVKPYIPDQLLSRLIVHEQPTKCNQDDAADDRTNSEATYSPHSPSPRMERLQSIYSARSSVKSHSPLSTTHRGRRMSCRKVNTAAVRGSTVSSEGTKQLLAMKDWTRRRCTYLCIRFGSTCPDGERRLRMMVRLAGRIVDIAKANDATIDSVGVDFVNVHWGVFSSTVSAVRAVNAGLEIAKLQDTLPEEQQQQQAAVWVQMGIGKGVCDCGTVSSESGHRFFVVWGAEASLAIEMAAKGLPQKVLASLLISSAVRQEVRYTVQCKPRLWHGDDLLWEPLFVQKQEENDEWMYELRRLDNPSVKEVQLVELFQLAKDGNTSAAHLESQINTLRSECDGPMCPKDVASLDLLLASVQTAASCLVLPV